MNDTGTKWPSRFPRFLRTGCPCRRCGSIRFRSAVPERLDGLFALLSLQPVLCVNCGCRYYWSRKAGASDGDQSIQRIRFAEQTASTKGKLR